MQQRDQAERQAIDPALRRVDQVLREVQKDRALRWRAKLGIRRRCQALGRPRVEPTWTSVHTRLLAVEADVQRIAAAIERGELGREAPTPVSAAIRGLPAGVRVGAVYAPVEGSELPGSGEPVRWQGGLGLNGVKAYSYEDDLAARGEVADLITRFGSAENQWHDARTLHVETARQFGPRDLLWRMVASWNDAPAARVPRDLDELRTLVVQGPDPEPDRTNVARFAQELADAWRQGIRLRFTFLTLGGGVDAILENDDTDAPTTELGARFTDLPEHVNAKAVLRLYWDEAFLDAAPPGRVDTELERRFYLSSLDVDDPTKRYYIQQIARGCAELLHRAAHAARALLEPEEAALFHIEQVLDGVEIFNEVEVRNVHLTGTRPDPEGSGRRWARAWAQAAFGLLDEWRSLGRTRWLPTLYLPGIASYSLLDEPDGDWAESPAGGSWNYKLAFLDAFLSELTWTWKALRRSVPLRATLPELDEVVGGIDYHWYHVYHRGSGSPAVEKVGALHAGWLATEVAALVATLEEHGLDGRVTVYENGLTSRRDTTSAGFRPYLLPAGGSPDDPITEDQAQRFQAADAIRRILAAAVGGAEQPGWHSWMPTGGRYAQFGLRTDNPVAGNPATEDKAKPLWFAFQRLASWFGGAGSIIRLVEPTSLPPRSELVLSAGDSADAPAGTGVFPSIWIFEIEGAEFGWVGGRDLSTHTVGYVMLSDPTVLDTPATRIRGEPVAGEPDALSVDPFALEPDRWELPVPADLSEVEERLWLPRYAVLASIPDPSPVSLAGSDATELVVERGAPPLVVAALSRVRWTLA